MKVLIILLLIHLNIVSAGRCPSKTIDPCTCNDVSLFFNNKIAFKVFFKDKIKCPSNVTNLNEIFKEASNQLNETERHFKQFIIYETDLKPENYLILNDSSFGDVTFDYFNGQNIKLIHRNAFGKATKTIKTIIIHNGYVNHEPPEYHVWNVLSGFVNINYIEIQLNITEIPSNAFVPVNRNQSELNIITLNTPNKLTINKMAFYNLNNLTWIRLNSKIKKIEAEAFSLSKKSNQLIRIYFEAKNLTGHEIKFESFEGIQRPVKIQFEYSNITFINQAAFKSLLKNINSNINFLETIMNCLDCRNQWLIRDKKDEHLSNAKCMHNNSLTLFNAGIEAYFNSNCNKENSINYYPCTYWGSDVSINFI